uniref:HAD superfamily hydrolase n=1 Tax=uncultured bacterium Contigcl_7 TaxID=1393677 RepID=W0FR47_9BACT|nr:HAD superfamily hydrolase [uncultured bacterium Contigcl_7]
MTVYIWDLDGTLLDSYGVITAAAVKTAAEAGVNDPESTVYRAVKQGSVSGYLKDVSARTGEPFEQLLARYRTHTHETDDLITLIDGAAETLERLRNAGAVHFVYTHRGKSSRPVLSRLGILDCFREVVTSEYGLSPKPSGAGVRYLLEKYGLDSRETWYVGDRTIDVLCAKDAGVQALLFLQPGICVSATGREDRIISDLREL